MVGFFLCIWDDLCEFCFGELGFDCGEIWDCLYCCMSCCVVFV